MNELYSATGIYLTVVTTFFVGFVLNIFGEKSPLNLKQASIVVVLSFVLLSLFGSLPYIYVNPFWNNIDYVSLFVNSFLESTSGFTTTGISTNSSSRGFASKFCILSFIYLMGWWIKFYLSCNGIILSGNKIGRNEKYDWRWHT